MSPKASAKGKLREAQDDLSALQTDLPKIEELLQQHSEAADEAKRNGVPYETLADLQAKRSGFESVLRQHRHDIVEAERRVNELQSQSDDEDALAVIARATARHGEIETELETLWTGIEGSVREAIARARTLADEGNDLLAKAEVAVKGYGERHTGHSIDRLKDGYIMRRAFELAVQGSDLTPLDPQLDRFREWPANHHDRYRALWQIDPDIVPLEPVAS